MGTIIEILKPCEEAKSLTQWDLGRKIIIRPDAETIVDEVRFSNVLSKKALVVEPTFDELGNIVSGIPNILLQSSLEIYVSVAMHFKDGKCVIHKETLEVAPEKKPSDYIYTEIEIKNYEELEQRIKALEEQGTGGNGKPGSDGFSPIANVVETTAGAVITITDKKGTTTATVKNGKEGKDGADGAKGDKGDTGAKGADGTSISIKNISESTVDGGNNVVTFSDGQKMIVKNGRKGSDGKTAYQYAKDGGYTGTEKEFAQKLAEEIGGVEITDGEPTKESTVMTLNPNAEEVNLYTAEEIDEMLQNLPSGEWKILHDITTTEDVSVIECEFEPVTELCVMFNTKFTADSVSNKYTFILVNDKNFAETTKVYNNNFTSIVAVFKFCKQLVVGAMGDGAVAAFDGSRLKGLASQINIGPVKEENATKIKIYCAESTNKFIAGTRLILAGR